MWQTTDAVLMIRPAAFAANPETAPTNEFQSPTTPPGARERASAEFDAACAALADAGVRVCVVDDEPDPARPDAIFPNNWITTHEDGTVVLYPMQAPSRRREVRRDVVDALGARFGYRIARVLDLTGWADRGRFLEGTGSMVIDRVSRTAFACRSPRTDAAVLTEFCHELDYAPHLFDALSENGQPVYHTNVMMWIGTQVAAACLDAVHDTTERERIAERLRHGGRRLFELSHAQMAAFAGNALELRGAAARPVVAVSARGHAALTDEQRATLAAYARVVTVGLDAIEDCSGGSFRCMLAEIFLPRTVGPE